MGNILISGIDMSPLFSLPSKQSVKINICIFSLIDCYKNCLTVFLPVLQIFIRLEVYL